MYNYMTSEGKFILGYQRKEDLIHTHAICILLLYL